MINKTILVTGSKGFIGSHLVETLLAGGNVVRALVRYNSKNSWGWLDSHKFGDALEVIAGDIRDFDFIYQGLKGCDCVYHLAALIGIPYSYISPLAYMRTNGEGTCNILEASRRLGLQKVIVTSWTE